MSLVMARLWSYLRVGGVSSLLWRNLKYLTPMPTFEGPIPPKRSLNPYIIFCSERLQGKGREGMKLAGKEWREIDPQEKKKYEEKSKDLKEKYEKEVQLFSQKFANEKELNLHLKKYSEYCKSLKSYRLMKRVKSKPIKVSAYEAMIVYRTSQLPPEKRFEYVKKQAVLDYRNLTLEERKKYEDVADNIYKQRMKEFFAEH